MLGFGKSEMLNRYLTWIYNQSRIYILTMVAVPWDGTEAVMLQPQVEESCWRDLTERMASNRSRLGEKVRSLCMST